MIVRRTGTSQLLITQPDHAALAGRIMRHWTAGGLPDSPRRREILLAVDEHDNGWKEADAAPIVDSSSGQILDFVRAPDSVRQGVWPRAVERLAAVPYSAALVAQHALHVYRRYRADPAWRAFFAGLEAARERHLGMLPAMTLHQLEADYPFLRLGDLISLGFCNGWDEPQEQAGYTVRVDGARVLVAPDPFAGRSVAIEVTALELPDRPFSSTADAVEAMGAAPLRLLHGVVCGEG